MCNHAVTAAPARRQHCGRCLRPLSVCYCSRIVRQRNDWPVYVVQDCREASHAIGTARIAALSLSQCQLVGTDPDQHVMTPELEKLQSLQPVLIYPGDCAGEIGELHAMPLRPLLFIDASWRRSRKILHVLPWIASLPRYALAAAPGSRYRIRQQPGPGSLSTLEAIVCTLQKLEPEPARFDSLLSTMDWVIDQQIKRMGHDTFQSNYLNKCKRSE